MAVKMLFGRKILLENLELLKSLRRARVRQVTPLVDMDREAHSVSARLTWKVEIHK